MNRHTRVALSRFYQLEICAESLQYLKKKKQNSTVVYNNDCKALKYIEVTSESSQKNKKGWLVKDYGGHQIPA